MMTKTFYTNMACVAACLAAFALSQPGAWAASHEAGEHADHGSAAMEEGEPRATGVVRSVNDDGQSLQIEHDPIPEIGMDSAMTMTFEVMGSADASALAVGDPVAFTLKQGRDGSYRIRAICNTRSDGDDCLGHMEGH